MEGSTAMSQMPQLSVLHNVLHQRFKEVFGEPDHTLGRDDHWALKPARPDGQAIPINVLVNGMPELPAVWVFDPNSRDDGVMRISVKDEAHLEDIIKQIQQRVKQASLPQG
jgi:hypothetical protein